MFACMHPCMYAFMHPCMYILLPVCVVDHIMNQELRIYVCAYIRTYVCTCLCLCVVYMCACMCACKNAFMTAHCSIQIYILKYKRTYTHPYAYGDSPTNQGCSRFMALTYVQSYIHAHIRQILQQAKAAAAARQQQHDGYANVVDIRDAGSSNSSGPAKVTNNDVYIHTVCTHALILPLIVAWGCVLFACVLLECCMCASDRQTYADRQTGIQADEHADRQADIQSRLSMLIVIDLSEQMDVYLHACIHADREAIAQSGLHSQAR